MNSEQGLLCLKIQRKILLDGTVTPHAIKKNFSSKKVCSLLFKGHWMPLFEISLSMNVIMCKSAMRCQSRLWPLFDEEWASSYSHHFTHHLRTNTFSFKKQNTKIANDIVKNWNNCECNEDKFKNTFSGYHINHKIPYRMIISTSWKNYFFLYFLK